MKQNYIFTAMLAVAMTMAVGCGKDEIPVVPPTPDTPDVPVVPEEPKDTVSADTIPARYELMVNVDWSNLETLPEGMTLLLYPEDGSEAIQQTVDNPDSIRIEVEPGKYNLILFNEHEAHFDVFGFRGLEQYETAEVYLKDATPATKADEADSGHEELGIAILEMPIVVEAVAGDTLEQVIQTMLEIIPERVSSITTVQVHVSDVATIEGVSGTMTGSSFSYSIFNRSKSTEAATVSIPDWTVTPQDGGTDGYIISTFVSLGLTSTEDGKAHKNEDAVLGLTFEVSGNSEPIEHNYEVGVLVEHAETGDNIHPEAVGEDMHVELGGNDGSGDGDGTGGDGETPDSPVVTPDTPSDPDTFDPEKPDTPDTPDQPGEDDPDNPDDPDQPGEGDEDPDQPGSDDPDQPGGNDPDQPGGEDPDQPEGDDPDQPGGDDPDQPGGDDPDQPGGDDPDQPGGDDPDQPGGEDPDQPGGDDPDQPGEGGEDDDKEDPVNPGDVNVNDWENGENIGGEGENEAEEK